MSFTLLTHTYSPNAATTSAIDTTGATLLVAVVSGNTNAGSLTDSKGNGWVFYSTGGNPACTIGVCVPEPSKVGTSHTLTQSGVSNAAIFFACFSTTSPRLITTLKSSSTNSGTSTISPGSFTPAVSGMALVAAAWDNPRSLTSIGSSFSTVDSQDGVAGVSYGGCLGYLTPSGTSALNPTVTLSGNGANACIQLLIEEIPAVAQVIASTRTLPNPPSTSNTSQAIDTTGADLLVFVAGNDASDLGTLTDSKGNTWNRIASPSGSPYSVLYWSAPTSVGSAHTVSFNSGVFAGSIFAAIQLNGTGALDSSSSAYSASASSISPGSIAPSAASNIVLLTGAHAGNTSIKGVDSGLSIVDVQPGVNSRTYGTFLALIEPSGAGALNPSVSMFDSNNIAAVMVSFEITPAAGAAGRPVLMLIGL